MIKKKKACVIYIKAMKDVAQDVKQKLEATDYNVCLTETSIDLATAAQLGAESVTSEIDACLADADAKVFLIPAGDTPSSLLGAAKQASKSPGRLIAICEKDAKLPQVFDEMANSVIPVGSQKVVEAVVQDDIWEGLNGTKRPPRTPERVKCQ
ncbi:hypothetical protein SAMN05518854_103131 [Variovorax sp. YR266]|uniref:hypothetical protein n=1 Tax=Variovorax sp. YR266 TaxID=1884386 RepID=UPI00089D01D5|nr:hypothetical protein [Variovorax sp. YR266]SDY97752.1 hypothetical protein SAMN05518854_103131 [Variovorax sp. YR266]